MKRAALVPAFLSIAMLAGCGVGDAGRWIVDTSLRSAYGCSLLVSSDQSAVSSGDVARRPEPLRVRDRSIVAARTIEPVAPPVVAIAEETERESVEIAEIPISRDLTSIRAAGTRHPRSVYRVARSGQPRFTIRVARPELPRYEFPAPLCPSSKTSLGVSLGV